MEAFLSSRTSSSAHRTSRCVETSSAPAANGSFKSFLELVSKESIQNWVRCAVAVHQDLEIGLHDVHVSAGKK